MKNNNRLKCIFIIKKIINNKFTLTNIYKIKNKENFIFIKNRCFNIIRNFVFIKYIIEFIKNNIKKNNILYYLICIIVYDMYYKNLKKYILYSEIKKILKIIKINNVYKYIIKYLNILFKYKDKMLMINNNILYYIKKNNFYKNNFIINKIIKNIKNNNKIKNILLPKKNKYLWIRINKGIIKNINKFYIFLEKKNIKFIKYKKFPYSIGISNFYFNKKILSYLYKNGIISIQNISSQKCICIIDPKINDTILDMCSAPGNKSLHILETCPNIKKIVLVEKNKKKINLIKKNIKRLKIKKNNNIFFINKNSKNLDKKYYNTFDKILIDAPCTSTGNMYKKPDSIFKNKKTFDFLINEQYELLKNSIKYLKKGGYIIYLTCSILNEENKNQIKKIIKNNKNIISILNEDKNTFGIKITQDNNLNIEGFFYSKIIKLY
ncbi:methyltransferase domain-containing protein [Candidatus Nardonella dryophthoridicola]|uniref:Ribosomal RNA small subunit methyltransferase B n=1 Tax=endosymbiont of Rhynchophorus ferrugineus TaxID=1972133 RepID=A0A2Z5T400_9GAMM|nr:methyltransferase domain-containing protein [Candidatus Nardonella dryophthoridicola]BBA85117.1 ribosomal RNA small subunit methyltransferase B [endosymbiont of Rhynchophorus ferrugineus]